MVIKSNRKQQRDYEKNIRIIVLIATKICIGLRRPNDEKVLMMAEKMHQISAMTVVQKQRKWSDDNMNIQNISKEKKEATIKLSGDDLVIIGNALYAQFDEKKEEENFLQLYSDVMMARDLCQYGHVDNFCLSNIVKCRSSIGNGFGGMLSDDDIDTFNAYLEGNDMPIAFKNTDWRSIYNKIVGNRSTEKLEKWIQDRSDSI